MQNPKESKPRGMKEMLRIGAKLWNIAIFMRNFRPSCSVITLEGSEFDYVMRWPKAAALVGILVTESGPYLGALPPCADKFPSIGFTIKRGNGKHRYIRERKPEQVTL